MSSSIPAQPAAPDYASANREGIQTDISTLPLRNQINQAAQLGQRIEYTDPVTGQTRVADFTGMGNAAAAQQAAQIANDQNATMQRQQLALRQELGVQNVQQTLRELQASDPRGFALRQSLTDRATQELNGPNSNIQSSQALLDSAHRISLLSGQQPGADERNGSIYDQATRLSTTAPGASSRLGSLYQEAQRLPGEARDNTTGALGEGLQAALNSFRNGGRMSARETQDMQNEVRAGQIARGNFLGDAAAVSEAVDLDRAREERAQSRLRSLAEVQNQAFGQNAQLRGETAGNAMNRLNAMSGLANTEYGQNLSSWQASNQAGLNQLNALSNLSNQDYNQRMSSWQAGMQGAQQQAGAVMNLVNDQRATRSENNANNQQRLANAQALALGAPITNQFAGLNGAQQGAVGFNNVGYNQVGQLNANAGQNAANFAQQNFGTQANMWGQSAQIASQGSPWMSALGSVAGAAAGMMM